MALPAAKTCWHLLLLVGQTGGARDKPQALDSESSSAVVYNLLALHKPWKLLEATFDCQFKIQPTCQLVDPLEVSLDDDGFESSLTSLGALSMI